MYGTLALCVPAVRAFWLGNEAKSFPRCWFKIRLGIFMDGVSGGSPAGKRVCCLFGFSAVPSVWHSETKTISFFSKLVWAVSQCEIWYKTLYTSIGRQRKKLTSNGPNPHVVLKVSGSLYQANYWPEIVRPSPPLYLPLPIIRFVNILYCGVCSHVDRLT